MISSPSRRLVVLSLLAGSLAFACPAASETTVTFDSLAADTVVTNQFFPGVSISLLDSAPIAGPRTYALQDTSGVPQVIFGASGNAITPAQIGNFAPFYDIQFVFTLPINYFSLMALDAEEPVSGSVYLDDTFISSITLRFIGFNDASVFRGPVYSLEFGAVGGSQLFNRVVIHLDTLGGPELFDNLVFQPIPDTIPPVLTLPGNITTDAISPSGRVVTYTVTATDNSGVTPTVSCYPLTGATFSIGPTTVNCTATDAASNSATGSFTVTVNGAVEQLSKLIATVGFYANPWTNSLDSKLQNAMDALNAINEGSASRACNSLRAFINEAQAQSGKKLMPDAAQLTASAYQIRAVLDCS